MYKVCIIPLTYYLFIVNMKKFIALLSLWLLLASCSLTPKGLDTPQEGDTVVVHYVGTYDDGEEFDSSRAEGRSPFEFQIGAQSVVTGFENAILGMKAWDVVKVRLEPKDAYGEEYIEQTIPKSQYQETLTQTVPTSLLLGKLEQEMDIEQTKQFFATEELSVGMKKDAGDAQIEILALTDTNAQLLIESSVAPFYGKELSVGAVATAEDGSVVTIQKIEGDEATVEIKPQQEIVSETDDEVTLKVKNTHPLAGKALNFEIELLEIKKPDANNVQLNVVQEQ